MMSSGSSKDQDGFTAFLAFVPYTEFTGNSDAYIAGTTTHALFPDVPSSPEQTERLRQLSAGAESGVFPDFIK